MSDDPRQIELEVDVVGTRVRLDAKGSPPMAGTILDCATTHLALLLDQPARSTAFLAVEGTGDRVGVSVSAYLYGADAEMIANRYAPLWQQWLTDNAGPADASP